MPRRERDYRAEYAARQARAQTQGYAGYREQRRARAEHRPLPTDPISRTRPPQPLISREGEWLGTASTSQSPAAIETALRAAAATGDRVAIRATFVDPLGRYRTRYIDRTTGAPFRHGGPGSLADSGNAGAVPTGEVQIIAGSTVSGAHHAGGGRTVTGGLNPQDILDLIDAYDGDVWAAIADMWDDLY